MIFLPGLLMANMPNPEAGGGVSNISFVNAVAYASSGGALPTGNVNGDIYLRSGMRTDGVPTPPTITAGHGWETITDTADISSTGGNGTTSGGRWSYKFSDEPTETSGAWTGSQVTIFGLYRGVHATTPILSAKWNAGTNGDLVFPALTHDDPTAWVVLMVRTANDVEINEGIYPIRYEGTRRAILDSNGTAGTFSGQTLTTSAAPGLWVTLAIALQSS